MPSEPNPTLESSRPLDADVFAPPDAIILDRMPIAYSPASCTQLNDERLPPLDETADMSLAFRRRTPAEARDNAILGLIGWLPLGFFLVLLASLTITRMMPIVWGIGLAGAVTAYTIGYAVFMHIISLRIVVRAIALPLLLVVGAYGASALIHNRLLITLLLALATAVLFFLRGRAPLPFIADWICAHRRLRPSTRRELRKTLDLTPTWWVLIATLAVAVIVPRYSTALAMILIAAICLYACLRHGLRELRLREGVELLGIYLAYGESDPGAPGVWTPTEPVRRRRMTMLLLAGSLFFTLGTGLTLYMPWDIARHSFERAVIFGVPENETIRDAFDSPFKPVDWDKSPAALMVTTGDLEGGHSDEESFRRDYIRGAVREFWSEQIGDRPYTWFFAAFAAVLQKNFLYLWSLPVALVLALVFPNLVLLTVYHEALRRATDAQRKTEAADGLDADDRTEWEYYVDRILPSDHVAHDPITGAPSVREADHLFLGVEPLAGFPVLLDRGLLNQHTYIVGQTGSGKTSLALMPMLIQLLRMDRDREDRDAPPIVVLDLKGDPALFHTTKHETEQRRERLGAAGDDDPRSAFSYFTPEPARSSFFFNPFRSMDSEHRSPMQLCELVLDSLGLAHGEGYGRSYYTRLNRMMLMQALEHPSKPRSFEDLYRVLEETMKSNVGEGKALFELAATIQSLSKYERLATDDSALPEHRTIHMPRLLEHGQVAYFWLPAATESVSVREIGKLALYSLLTAAIDRHRDRKDDREIYLVVDEFQRIAGANFRVILEQARSFGVRIILANQSISDLNTPDADLRPSIRTNTRVKMHFSVSDPREVADLVDSSGDEMFRSHSFQYTYAAKSRKRASDGSRESVPIPTWQLAGRTDSLGLKPRLTKNDIIRASDHPQEFILQVSQGSGYTQFSGVPLPVRTTWPISRETFVERTSMEWPELAPTKEDPSPQQEHSPEQIDRSARSEFFERYRPAALPAYEAIFEKLGPLEDSDA